LIQKGLSWKISGTAKLNFHILTQLILNQKGFFHNFCLGIRPKTNSWNLFQNQYLSSLMSGLANDAIKNLDNADNGPGVLHEWLTFRMSDTDYSNGVSSIE